MKVFTIAQMRAAEAAANDAGLAYADMMETAGRGVAEALIARHDVVDRAILVLVGPGNNGGDGLVAGRYLHFAGAKVVFYLYGPRDAAEDINFAQVEELKLPVLRAEDDQRFRVLRLRLNGVDIILDGLTGIGVNRRIDGELAKLMRQVKAGIQERIGLLAAAEANARREEGFEVSVLPVTIPLQAAVQPKRPLVVAIDCPSGLHCDTGLVDPLTISADLTVTFAGPKRGHFLFPGASVCGETVVVDLGLAPDTIKDVPVELMTPKQVARYLPQRPADGHKGTFGRILIAAGSDEYRGAPLLAAKGAFRAGAGLVSLAVPEVVRDIAVTQIPEATFPPLAAREHLGHTAEQQVLSHVEDYKAFLVGPGLGDAESFVYTFLSTMQKAGSEAPVVIDADALNVLAHRDDWMTMMPKHAILTPHPGEMARLMNVSLDELKGMNRFDVALSQAQEWHCTLVLKGAHTIVATASGQAFVVPFANPLLSMAGSGDVLGGIIVALLGQGVAPEMAALAGVTLHGVAGEIAAQDWGDSGLLASELADFVPAARRLLKSYL